MSYKALYRTYRPSNFASIVGQSHIVATLENIISSKKIGHAYLFTGPRGTGKTSAAHIFAREVNRNVNGDLVFSELDIIEIDAASNNGVAEIRSLIDNSRYAPTESMYKVYIIDEVHMLTKGAFNALLKTLEEPPRHVIFILATTEPHALPATILSRCQRFNFHRIEDHDIQEQLTSILLKEKITFEKDAIKLIARLAQGGMRDALSIADQVSAFSGGKISLDSISKVFGIVSRENQITLLNYSYASKTRELMHLASDFLDSGADIERLCIALIEILKDHIVYSKTSDETLLENIDVQDYKLLDFTTEFSYNALDILVQVISNLRHSEMPRQTFELALLKMVSPAKVVKDAIEEVVEKVVASEKRTIQEVTKPVEVRKPFKPSKTTETNFFDNLFKVTPSQIEKTQELPLTTLTLPVNLAELKTDEYSVFGKTKKTKTQETSKLHELDFDDEKADEFLDLTKLNEIKREVEANIITVPDYQTIVTTMPAEPAVVTPSNSNTEEVEISMTSTNSLEDIMKIFTVEKKVQQTGDVEVPTSHSVEEVLNLLVQSNKGIVAEIKNLWPNILSIGHQEQFISFATDLNETKIIAAGENFILVSSKDQKILDNIYAEYRNESFLQFTKAVFNKPLFIFTVSQPAFEIVKDTYKQLLGEKNLPLPIKIETPAISPETKSEEQAYAEDLFGDLFK